MKLVDADKLIEAIRSGDFPKKGELHRLILQLAFDVPEISDEKLEEIMNGQIDMTNVYYPGAMQVRYIDPGRAVKFGIVFHEFLIDLLTGRTYTCKEILRAAQRNGIDLDDAIIESSGWIDLSEVFHI